MVGKLSMGSTHDRHRKRHPVAVVVGTRPEAVKLAPVARCLASSSWADPTIVATGQHGDVVDDVLRAFDLKAEHELAPVAGDETVTAMNARLLHGLGQALAGIGPDLVVVQGDTASTLAGALAGFFRRVPVAHVEAGLRTHDLDLPFPEEANRRLVAQVAALHFTPTRAAAANLRAEGVADERVVVTGNTGIDALLMARAREPDDGELDGVDPDRPLVVVTAHRRESWGEPIRSIGRAVARLAHRHPECQVVVAGHLNPAVRHALEAGVGRGGNVILSGPLAYGPFARLLGRARLVITDSGGIQEEATALGVPVLVTRAVTERTEGVDAGVARLVGTDEDRVTAEASALLGDPAAHAAMRPRSNPYGDGAAAGRVAAGCGWLLGAGERPAPFCPATPTTVGG